MYFSHFGKASDGVKRLEDYKVQLEMWAKIVKEGVRENQSFEQIRNRIIAEDKVMNQVAEVVKSHRIYSKTVLENCIDGFIEYTKHFEAKPNS